MYRQATDLACSEAEKYIHLPRFEPTYNYRYKHSPKVFWNSFYKRINIKGTSCCGRLVHWN